MKGWVARDAVSHSTPRDLVSREMSRSSPRDLASRGSLIQVAQTHTIALSISTQYDTFTDPPCSLSLSLPLFPGGGYSCSIILPWRAFSRIKSHRHTLVDTHRGCTTALTGRLAGLFHHSMHKLALWHLTSSRMDTCPLCSQLPMEGDLCSSSSTGNRMGEEAEAEAEEQAEEAEEEEEEKE